MTAVLVFSAIWILYVYLGFPLVTWLHSRIFPRQREVSAVSPVLVQPDVSVIVCAYNEAAAIIAKLDSLAEQDYPAAKIEIIVASDGSTDETVTLVAGYKRRRIRLLELGRQGKVATLNSAVKEASGDLLVFTDANSILNSQAISSLVAEFVDPQVGGVACDQAYFDPAADDDSGGERAYWDLERQLKRWQSCSGSVTSSTGALHALRAHLFEPIPGGVTDDFAISTLAVAAGKRLIFCERAVAYEAPTGTVNNYARKRRIMTRGLNGVKHRVALLNPWNYGFYSHQLLVQKVLRRLTFVPLMLVYLASLALASESKAFLVLFCLQTCFGALCYLGSRNSGPQSKLLQYAGYFWTVNSAAAAAFKDFLLGHTVEAWNPRAGEENYS